jgi:ACS family glucarate transporter-like MFS transporter
MASTRQVRWTLIGWLFVLSAVAYLDRVNISIAGKLMAQEYALSNQQLGYVFSAFVLGYALFQAPSGRAADRFGARRTLTLAAIWWAVFSSLTAAPFGLAFALPLLLVTRFLLGAGEAVIYPASNRVVAKWIPVSERGLANGVIFMGVGVGAGITPPLVTSVMLRFGWRASFVACGLIGVLAGAVWWLIARDSPDEHRAVSARERRTSRGHQKLCLRLRLLARYRDQQKRPAAHDQLFLLRLFRVHLLQLVFHLPEHRAWHAAERGALYAMLPFIAMAIGSALGDTSTIVCRERAVCAPGGAAWPSSVSASPRYSSRSARKSSARIASVIRRGARGRSIWPKVRSGR